MKWPSQSLYLNPINIPQRDLKWAFCGWEIKNKKLRKECGSNFLHGDVRESMPVAAAKQLLSAG